MCQTSIGLHLSQVLSAAPRCWSLVAGTALLALGITQPEVWRLWTNKTHLSFSQRQSRRTQGEQQLKLNILMFILNLRKLQTSYWETVWETNLSHVAQWLCNTLGSQKLNDRHPHPQNLSFTLVWTKEEQGKLKNKSAERGRMWATDEQWWGPARTEQRGWVQPERPHQLTVLTAVVLML